MSRKRERSEDIPPSFKKQKATSYAEREDTTTTTNGLGFSFNRNLKPSLTIEEQITEFLRTVKDLGRNAGEILDRIGASEATHRGEATKPKPQHKQVVAPRITMDADEGSNDSSSSDSDSDSGAESRNEEEAGDGDDTPHHRAGKRNGRVTSSYRKEKAAAAPSPPPTPKAKPRTTRAKPKPKPKPARSAETDAEQDDDAGFNTDADNSRAPARRNSDNNALAAFKKGGKLDDKINKLVLAYLEAVVYLLLAPFTDQPQVRRQVAKNIIHSSITDQEKERLENFFTEVATKHFPQTACIQRSEIVNVMAIFAPGLATEHNRDTSIAIWNQIKSNAERLEAQAISDEELAGVWHPKHSAQLADGLPSMLFFLSNPAAFVATIYAFSPLYQKQVSSMWNPFCGEHERNWTRFVLTFSDPDRPDPKKLKIITEETAPSTKGQALTSHSKIIYRVPEPATMAMLAEEKTKNTRNTTSLSFPPKRKFSELVESESGTFPIDPPRLDVGLVFTEGSEDVSARWMTKEEREMERLPTGLFTAYFKGFFEKERTAVICGEQIHRVSTSALDALYKSIMSNPDAKMSLNDPEPSPVHTNSRAEERSENDLDQAIKTVGDLSELPSDPILLEEGEEALMGLANEAAAPQHVPPPAKKTVTIAPTPEKEAAVPVPASTAKPKKPALKAQQTPTAKSTPAEKKPIPIKQQQQQATSNGKNHNKPDAPEHVDYEDDDEFNN